MRQQHTCKRSVQVMSACTARGCQHPQCPLCRGHGHDRYLRGDPIPRGAVGRWLRNGSGQTRASYKSAANTTHFAMFCRMHTFLKSQIPHICATHTHTTHTHTTHTHTIHVSTNAMHLAMQIDNGKLQRHFCEDPVCPDPVWKLSSWRARWSGDTDGAYSNMQQKIAAFPVRDLAI